MWQTNLAQGATGWLRRPALALSFSFCVALSGGLPAQAGPGGMGNATEWTQLANNSELIALVRQEGRNFTVLVDTLNNEVNQLMTQIQTYQAILRNLKQLPDRVLAEAMAPVHKLREVMDEARAIAASAKNLDEFLRSDLITDPLFDGKPLSDARLTERYDEWLEVWDGALESSLKQVGLTFEDIATEADLLDQISGRFSGVEGNLQALQVSNELASSVARQMNGLRALTATQVQQNAAAWSRILDDLDRKESAQRELDVEVQKSIEAYDAVETPRSVNEILDLGR